MRKQYFKYDKFGVPILSNIEIEYYAVKFLEKYYPKALIYPQKSPSIIIFYKLIEMNMCNLMIDDLGYKDNYKIRGKIIFSENIIFIDRSLFKPENEHMLLFTVAHEMAHWVLHRHREIFINRNLMPEKIILHEDCDQSKLQLEFQLTPERNIERQANCFAANILMPKEMLYQSLIAIQKELGIIRNLGKIYIANNFSSKRDYYIIINKLSNLFGVSKTSVEIRLKSLKLVYDSQIYLQNH